MGIKGLGTVLRKKKGGDYDRYGKLSDFAGKRIAIDASGLFYTKRSTAVTNEVENMTLEEYRLNDNNVFRTWIEILIHSIMYFIYCDVIPVIVFDGKNKHAKKDTIEKRITTRKKHEDRLEELLELMDSLPIHKRKPETLEEIRKCYKNICSVSRRDIKAAKRIFRKIGFPVCQAHGEGEKLAASLYREGKVSAVYSQDSDLYILGCDTVITKMANVNLEASPPNIGIRYVSLSDILEILEMNYSELVHFAIMLGCDFNSNIAGVGMVGSEKLIREYHDVYKIDKKTKHDLTILNFDCCAAFFDYTPSDQCSYSIQLDMTIMDPKVIELLESLGIDQEAIDVVKNIQVLSPPEVLSEREKKSFKRILPEIIHIDDEIEVDDIISKSERGRSSSEKIKRSSRMVHNRKVKRREETDPIE